MSVNCISEALCALFLNEGQEAYFVANGNGTFDIRLVNAISDEHKSVSGILEEFDIRHAIQLRDFLDYAIKSVMKPNAPPQD